MSKRSESLARAPASGLTRETMIAGALALLDKGGIDGVTPRALADWLGADPDLVRRYFARQNDLLDEMALALTRDMRAEEAAGPWQDHLRHRANAAYHAMTSRRDGAQLVARTLASPRIFEHDKSCIAALTGAGFTEKAAHATIMLIDRLTLGWALAEQAGPQGESEIFADQLEIVLQGMAPGKVQADDAMPDQYRLFQNRLYLLLRAVRESADIAYSRTLHIAELDRRILLLLKSHGGLNVAEISVSTGVDKAQVSRAVKRVEGMTLVDRATVRSPLRLNSAGHRLTEQMMRLAELRNRELTFGVTDEQLVEFFSILEILMARAVQLYEQERKLAGGGRPDIHHNNDLADAHNAMVVERSRILPPLITLATYLQRSGALAFKRLTGLSSFEAWVLTEIGKDPPLDWGRLVRALERDHSQAGRTVRHLSERGLIERHGRPGRRNGSFSPTPEGMRLFTLISGAGQQRSEFLLQDIPAPQLSRFLAWCDVIMRNAEAQLEREHAVEEIHSGREVHQTA